MSGAGHSEFDLDLLSPHHSAFPTSTQKLYMANLLSLEPILKAGRWDTTNGYVNSCWGKWKNVTQGRTKWV